MQEKLEKWCKSQIEMSKLCPDKKERKKKDRKEKKNSKLTSPYSSTFV